MVKAPRDPEEAVTTKKMSDLWMRFMLTAAALRPLFIRRQPQYQTSREQRFNDLMYFSS